MFFQVDDVYGNSLSAISKSIDASEFVVQALTRNPKSTQTLRCSHSS